VAFIKRAPCHKRPSVELSKDPLGNFPVAQQDSWGHFVPNDGNWLYLSNDEDIIWFQEREAQLNQETKIISAAKGMLTISWWPVAIHIIDLFLECERFHSH
jgi:hypothetical protein